MSTTRGANKSRHWVFTDRRKRTEAIQKKSPFPPLPPYLQAIWFQGRTKCEQEKKTLLGGSAGVPNFACVATHYPRPGSGMLTRFPFDRLGAPRTAQLKTDFSYLLGSTNPCPIAVHMEPFSTSVFKVLVWIFATTTKICTKGRFTPAHAASCTTTLTPSYSSGPSTCPDGRV